MLAVGCSVDATGACTHAYHEHPHCNNRTITSDRSYRAGPEVRNNLDAKLNWQIQMGPKISAKMVRNAGLGKGWGHLMGI